MKIFRLSPLALALVALTFSLAVCAQAQTMTYLATLNSNGLEGNGPFGSVVQAPDGNFYGTTDAGGPYNSYGYGTFYRVTPSGELTDIYNFCSLPKCTDGANPTSVPIVGSDGNLYGVAGEGGSDAGAGGGSGTVYKMTLDGQLTTLHTFCATPSCADGQAPTGLVLAGDGNFYGSTSVVPNSNGGYGGTIFSITAKGDFKVLYTLCSLPNCADGDFMYYPPILGSDGNLYGVTYQGGTSGGGVLFQLTPSGTYTVIYSFPAFVGPFFVVRDTNGNFFGTSVSGGSPGNGGAVFDVTSTNQFITLHTFNADTEPVWPSTGLTLANDGNIYGVDGGAINNGGQIFKVTPAGEFTRLYGFVHKGDGTLPTGPLFQGTDGSFYGATIYGPGNTDGSVFKFSDHLRRLVETVPTRGGVGQGVLILGNGLTGSTSVTFNGVAASFTVESDTYIKATVPAGATTGVVSVVTPSGTLNSNPQFTVTK